MDVGFAIAVVIEHTEARRGVDWSALRVDTAQAESSAHLQRFQLDQRCLSALHDSCLGLRLVAAQAESPARLQHLQLDQRFPRPLHYSYCEGIVGFHPYCFRQFSHCVAPLLHLARLPSVVRPGSFQ